KSGLDTLTIPPAAKTPTATQTKPQTTPQKEEQASPQPGQKRIEAAAPCARKAEESKKRADQLEARMKAEARAKAGLAAVVDCVQGSAAYQRFYSYYRANVPARLPEPGVIAAQTELPPTEWGSQLVFSPKDRSRPGVVFAMDPQHEQAVQDVVRELREATSKVLTQQLGLGYLDRFPGGELLKLANPTYRERRANAILVARSGEFLERSIDEANSRLADVPRYAAAEGTQRALAQTPSPRIFRRIRPSASERLEMAAQGGRGSGRFEAGLVSGLGEAQQSGRTAVGNTRALIVERARQYAFEGAAKVEQEAIAVNKEPTLVGYEVDFKNQRPNGIDYYVKTDEGQTYVVHNVGKNFQDEAGNFLPADVYAAFNVDLLTHYETNNGSISREALYDFSMKRNLFPTEEGEIVYLNPAKRSAEAQEAITGRLRTLYQAKKGLSRSDIDQAILEETQREIAAARDAAMNEARSAGLEITGQNGAFAVSKGGHKLLELPLKGSEVEQYTALKRILELRVESSGQGERVLDALAPHARNHALSLRLNQAGEIECVLPGGALETKIAAKPDQGLDGQLREALALCQAYDQTAPVAVENGLSQTNVMPVDAAQTPQAHQIFRAARDAGLTMRVVERSGEGSSLAFTYAVIKRETDGAGKITESEVGSRITIKRVSEGYETDAQYAVVRNTALANELAKQLGLPGIPVQEKPAEISPRGAVLKEAQDAGFEISGESGRFVISRGEHKLLELQLKGSEADQYGALREILALRADAAGQGERALDTLARHAKNHALFLHQDEEGNIAFVFPDGVHQDKILTQPGRSLG
ncbi:MAG TPA: hypothetical protein PLP17_06670, partial [Oligoflexia bacterium]|nr:hypothetical protein [Oligoflexia bacterium]